MPSIDIIITVINEPSLTQNHELLWPLALEVPSRFLVLNTLSPLTNMRQF